MNEVIYEAIICVEFLSVIIASVYFFKNRKSKLKYFLYFLWYSFLNELVGKYLADYSQLDNTIMYNVYLIIYFLFIFYLYWDNLERKLFKNVISILTIIYSLVYIVNFFVLKNFTTKLQVYPFMIGSCFLIITVILYFIEVLNSEKIVLMTKELLFWISLGLLLFNIGIIPWLIMLSYFPIVFVDNLTILKSLFNCLVIILYICYIIGFICGHKTQKQQLS